MYSRFSQDGFILDYLVSEISIFPYSSEIRDKDQLKLEKMMREDIVSKKEQYLPADYLENHNWKYNYSFSNIFVDKSDFYSTPKIIRFSAATSILAKRNIDVDITLWTYSSTSLYHDGKLALSIEPPCYKPIKSKATTLSLHKGENILIIELENLGVRDSRNLFALQITSDRSELETSLPISDIAAAIEEPINFLDNIKIKGNTIIFPFKAPIGAKAIYPDESVEFHKEKKLESVDISSSESLIAKEGHSIVRIEFAGMARTIELASTIKPEFNTIKDKNERFKATLGKIAEIKSLDRGEHGFAIFNILARKALGCTLIEDRELLQNDLALIEKRVDCSDFLLAGLIRYIKNYNIDNDLSNEIKRILLGYRYWMDMDGQDGMCFWSENHSLMFYQAAYLIGQMYPEDYFTLAKMKGSELSVYGRTRLSDWLDDVIESGFEEFQSSVYMCVTFAALLNVFDYADAELSKKSAIVLDKMVDMLSKHVFKGTVISPMGRIYRDCLYPFRGGSTSILSLEMEDLCYDYAEGWISFYATTGYKVNPNIRKLIDSDHAETYSTGNAQITLEKNKDYILTSVSSPREDSFKRWSNTILAGNADQSKHSYTKSMNECFHGTSYFLPGCYGYQQHLWYAALSSEAVIFVNHPGTSSEESSMRPGYWYGNGVFPALKQTRSELYGIYAIPANHPIQFIHAYIPKDRFDECIEKDNWIFLKKGSGYIALYTSKRGKNHNDMIFNSELRFDTNKLGFFVMVGDEKEYGSFKDFILKANGKNPNFSFPYLYVDGEKKLEFMAYKDETQIVD